MAIGAMLGFHCAHEQRAPSELLRQAKLASEAGFTTAMCSDHFHPWSDRQGHSGFAWSWLGAALETTRMSFGTVCAPGQRYHPAVIAQAAATLAEMYPRRFWLAVGSGEALNEAITGQDWPSKATRNERLRISADVMRALWAGQTVSTRGLIITDRARLYSRPCQPPLLLGAALSAETARWMGSWVDGLITVTGPRDAMRAVTEAFREGGGEGKPMFLQVTLSFAATDAEAVATAYDQWRHAALSRERLADVRTPAAFDQASAHAKTGDVLAHVRASSDINRHIAWLQQDCELGFERMFLHNVAQTHQERFIELCGTRLIPALTAPPCD